MKLCKILILVLSLSLTIVGQATTTIHATGLNTPNKIIKCPENSLLVAEAGTMVANTGRISVVDRTSGARHTLIAGLPSALNFLGGNPNGDPSGPSGLFLRGTLLYVTIGSGNSVMPGGGPGLETPNPTPASPIFNSILEIDLPGGYPSLGSSFTLTFAQQTALDAGNTVTLSNLEGQEVEIRVVKNFPDWRPAPTPTVPGNVKASNLYGIEMWKKTIYVADAGHNEIKGVSLRTGATSVLVTFPPRPNPIFPIGGPFIEAVPDNLHRFGNRLLVPLLTGFPFIVGGSEIQIVNIRGGTSEVLIDGLSSAIDIVKASEDKEELVEDAGEVSRPIQGRSDVKLDLIASERIDVFGGKGDASAERVSSGGVSVSSGGKLDVNRGPLSLDPGEGNAYYTLEFSTDMRNGTPGRLRFYADPDATPLELVTNLTTPTSMTRDGDNGNIFITNIGPGTVTKVSFP